MDEHVSFQKFQTNKGDDGGEGEHEAVDANQEELLIEVKIAYNEMRMINFIPLKMIIMSKLFIKVIRV